MRVLCDAPKRAANLKKHGLDLGRVSAAFFETAVIIGAKEGRFLAFGSLDGRLVAVVFKPLGSEAISVISLRQASRKEKRAHGQDH